MLFRSAIRFRKEINEMKQTKEEVQIIWNNENYFKKIEIDTKEITCVKFPNLFRHNRKLDIFFLSVSQPSSLFRYLKNKPKEPFGKEKISLSMPVGRLYKRMKNAEQSFFYEISKYNKEDKNYLNSIIYKNRELIM